MSRQMIHESKGYKPLLIQKFLLDLTADSDLTPSHLFIFGSMLVAVFLLVASSSLHYWDEYFYLYSVSQHEPGSLFTMEQGLDGIFPPGFFVGKAGFIYLLDFLVDHIGNDPSLLYLVQAIFSLLTILYVISSYALLNRLLPHRDAVSVSVILLFTPLVMYFSGKVLTEIPSLLLANMAAYSFLRSFDCSTRRQWSWILFAIFFLFTAIWIRFISVVFFAGMIFGLFAMHSERFPFRKVFMSAAVTGLGAVALLAAAWLLFLDGSAGSILALLGHLVERTHGVIIRFYALTVFVQLFAFYLIMALWMPWSGLHRLAIVWVLFTSVPFLIGSSYAEPRFFYMALLPFSILVWLGMKRLAEIWPKIFASYKGWVIFMLLVAFNRWFLVPLMPTEHDQAAYRDIMDIATTEKQANYLIPWLSDYSLLRLMYPDENIYLVKDWTRTGDDSFYSSNAFKEWIGGCGYVANLDELHSLPFPWRYTGWGYNYVIKSLRDGAEAIGLSTAGIDEGQKNHLELGWPWQHEKMSQTRLHTDGHYEIYDLLPVESRSENAEQRQCQPGKLKMAAREPS